VVHGPDAGVGRLVRRQVHAEGGQRGAESAGWWLEWGYTQRLSGRRSKGGLTTVIVVVWRIGRLAGPRPILYNIGHEFTALCGLMTRLDQTPWHR
jgi:hypothetical protein